MVRDMATYIYIIGIRFRSRIRFKRPVNREHDDGICRYCTAVTTVIIFYFFYYFYTYTLGREKIINCILYYI